MAAHRSLPLQSRRPEALELSALPGFELRRPAGHDALDRGVQRVVELAGG